MSGHKTLPTLPEHNDSDAASFLPATSPAAGFASGIRLLVSACLLSDEVRYDKGYKYDALLVESLGPFITWERVCPEVDAGMPTPRPSMHLVGDLTTPRLVSRTGDDLTGRCSSSSQSSCAHSMPPIYAATYARRIRQVRA